MKGTVQVQYGDHSEHASATLMGSEASAFLSDTSSTLRRAHMLFVGPLPEQQFLVPLTFAKHI